jgi:hypothetical protein
MMRSARIPVATAFLASIGSVAAIAAPADDGQLAGIRKLSVRMLKSTLGGDSAYCERAYILAQGGCLGSGRIAQRIRIDRKGLVEAWAHQPSPGSGAPIGYARGRISEAQWKMLLRNLADMRSEPLPPGMPMPLPPEANIPVPEMTLADGKDKAEYRNAGPSQGSIGDAFAQMDILARSATDTVWALALVRPKAEIRKDSLLVTAEWSWRGTAGARILFSGEPGGKTGGVYCGTAAFKWYLDTSDVTVEWRTAIATPGKGKGMNWELPGSKANPLRLAFPYPGQKGKDGKVKRVGVLEGVGIRVIPVGSKDTVSATLSSERFDF